LLTISIHGLIRGEALELGRDADTGGQTLYVVELMRALGERPEVSHVDLLTRYIADPQVDEAYSRTVEPVSDKTRIVRIPCGGDAYLPKEELWDSLDDFVDNTLDYIRAQADLPHIIHSHYADAGYVGARLSHMLGIPLIHTGHSLGRVKRRRLLAGGLGRDVIESRYRIGRRIAAEEEALSAASVVITSTRQEIEDQYAHYDYYSPGQMKVVPPGTDLARFHPPDGDEWSTAAGRSVYRFLREPAKPMILALSRPDQRKNIIGLVEAFGGCPELQAAANLVVVAGTRDDIVDLEPGARRVLTDVLLAVDRYDLYGKIAYPKTHASDDVPEYYRLAALSGGVFVNPALTEPFGLTLLESAASGLPIVATEDGGPVDIIENCGNGLLVDPLDPEAIAAAILDLVTDTEKRERFARAGLDGVRRHYTWTAHAEKYLAALREPLERAEPLPRRAVPRTARPYRDRALFTDIDQNLMTEDGSLETLSALLRDNSRRMVFGVATGRSLESALKILRRRGIPRPDVLISSLGTEIHYAPGLNHDEVWARHVDHLWNRLELTRILGEIPGLTPQPAQEQGVFKLSYLYDADIAPGVEEIRKLMHREEQSVNVFLSFGRFLDVVPVRASKGYALRWFADQREVPLEHVLAAGGSGADEDMMRGNTLAVVVANRHHEELSGLRNVNQIYFAKRPGAGGILEAVDHYDFLGACAPPDSDDIDLTPPNG
jgi:sucrose-phosphate synthase